ncbi:MAG: response regulator [Desulfobulbaceae bacterium]|nr:response regulator [Desulfobulbaceae bacterium]
MIEEVIEKLSILLQGKIPDKIDDGEIADASKQKLARLVNQLVDVMQETHDFINPLSRGELEEIKIASNNFFASPFKELHSRLLHLTWQAKEVANGDFSQRVDFMGDFSAAFNSMIVSLDNNEKLLKRKIDERHKAEKEANEARERLDVTLRSIGDGVVVTDLDGKIVLINKITEQLTGVSQEEAVGRLNQEIFNIINEKTGKPCENPATKVLATGKIVASANHTALIARDGTQYSIKDSGAPIYDNEDKIIGTVLVFRDVTEEKRTAEELFKVRKLESVGVLAGGIAHDFNNLLTVILGNIELAGMSIDSTSETYLLLQNAKKASIKAQNLTQKLLTFSKGGDPVKQTSLIGKIIIDSAEFELRGSSVVCDYNIPDDLWKVDVDIGQMGQVIQNIILNARHAMAEGGVIDVSCENIADIKKETVSLPGQKYIKITIADTGSGVPKEYIDRIFDPYFSTKQTGSGLGLAVCHSIISKHDGNMSVKSLEGKGTNFTIYLPASLQSGQDTRTSEEDFAETERKTRILVMDDETMVRDVAKQMLERLGHEVVLAENGHKAIELYNEYFKSGRSIDVIIMDLTIQGSMGGNDAVQEILRINPEAKVVVASGSLNDSIMANYQEHGFKSSIAKPFQMAALNKTINTILE